MKILNFGSLNIDHVYEMEHFVQPGETFAASKLDILCGGKGLNQSVALAKAGAEVWHAGKVGPDGGMLLDMLHASGVDTSFVLNTDTPTGHAIIQVDKRGQNCIILYGGSNQELTKGDIDAVLENFSAGDIVLLQNEVSNIDYIIKRSHECGLKVAINPSPIDAALVAMPELDCIDWFILNEIEGREITGKTDWQDILAAMHARFKGAVVVLTLGKDGAVYSDGAKTVKHGIYDVKPVDTTAAGDTFTGYFLATISAGETPERAMELASRASSIGVGIKGAAVSIPTLDSVIAADIKPLK